MGGKWALKSEAFVQAGFLHQTFLQFLRTQVVLSFPDSFSALAVRNTISCARVLRALAAPQPPCLRS